MKKSLHALWSGAMLLAAGSAVPAQTPAWSQPRQPFRIHGNTWYVGTQGLSAILITSARGHVLLDGTLEQNVAQVEANIRALGFRVRDIKAILNSHAHFDHAGGIARLAGDSGARVWASQRGAAALMAGGNEPDDPQHGFAGYFPAIARVSAVGDGDSVRVGDLVVTAHYTPGHTPGSTSWTWRSCAPKHCLAMVYADSLSAIVSDGFRFSDDQAHPHRVEDFRRSLATVAGLPCDVLLTPHPDASGFMEKVALRDRGGRSGALIDPAACRNYAATARVRLDARLAEEARLRPSP